MKVKSNSRKIYQINNDGWGELDNMGLKCYIIGTSLNGTGSSSLQTAKLAVQ